MRVYVAGSIWRRDELLGLAGRLAIRGFAPVARWLLGDDNEHDPANEASEEDKARYAHENLIDVGVADVVVVVAEEPFDRWNGRPVGVFSPGHSIETGYALALEKPVIVLASRPLSVFHRLKGVTVVNDEAALMRALRELRRKTPVASEVPA